MNEYTVIITPTALPAWITHEKIGFLFGPRLSALQHRTAPPTNAAYRCTTS
jgi:hypothetical protein